MQTKQMSRIVWNNESGLLALGHYALRCDSNQHHVPRALPIRYLLMTTLVSIHVALGISQGLPSHLPNLQGLGISRAYQSHVLFIVRPSLKSLFFIYHLCEFILAQN
jgi:hypothetical protein